MRLESEGHPREDTRIQVLRFSTQALVRPWKRPAWKVSPRRTPTRQRPGKRLQILPCVLSLGFIRAIRNSSSEGASNALATGIVATYRGGVVQLV